MYLRNPFCLLLNTTSDPQSIVFAILVALNDESNDMNLETLAKVNSFCEKKMTE